MFIVQQKSLRVNDLNAEVYWADEDEYTDRETVNLAIEEDECDSQRDLDAGVHDFLIEDNQTLHHKKKQRLMINKAKKVLAVAQKCKRYVTQQMIYTNHCTNIVTDRLLIMNVMNRFEFRLFKSEFFSQI